MICINKTKYLPIGSSFNLIQDDPSSFLNSIKIIPHDFGHQCNSCNITTDGYRLIGDYEIIYFIGGKSYVKIGNKEYICKKGDFIFIPPFIKNSIDTSSVDPHDNYFIHFDVSPLPMTFTFSNLFIKSENYLIHVGYNDSLISIYQKLEKKLNSKTKGFSLMLRASILLILMEVLDIISTKENISLPDITTSDHKLTNRIVTYIKENIENIDSVSSLYKKFNISKTHLNNIFKKNIGTPPGKLIQYQKLKEAEILLLTTSLTIEEISYKLSYSSPSYFNNIFKKYYDISPGKYRKTFL